MNGLESNVIQLTIEDAKNAEKELEFPKAIKIYQKLIESQPDNPFFYSKSGQAFAMVGNWKKAIEHYRKAIELGIEDSFWIYKILGDALREEQKFDEAIAIYEKALTINGKNPEVYDSLGQVQSLKGDFNKAIASYQQALKLGISNSFWTHKNLADALFEEGKLDEAKAAYQEAHELQPNNAFVIERIEEIQQNLPDKTLDNNWLEIHNKGDECFKQEKWSEAIALYKQAIELNPNYVWSYCNISRALAKLQIFDELQYYCTLAIEMNSNHSEIYGYIGDIFAQQKQWELADYYYRQAISLDRSNLPLSIFQNYNEVLEAKKHQRNSSLANNKKLKDRLIEHHHLIAKKPENSGLYKAMADDLVKLGEINQAIVCYKLALQLDPNNTAILNHLNEILPAGHNRE